MASATLRDKRNIVRAWFDTVLNPVIEGLEAESELLRQRKFTWRASAGHFASLLPVRSFVRSGASVNLDQFLTIHPQVVPLIERHDLRLKSLEESASVLVSSLTSDLTFRAMAEGLSVPGSGAVDEEQKLRVLAEYILNGVERLSQYYSTAEFWNKYSGEFLALRDSPGIRPQWSAVVSDAEKFHESAIELNRVLAEIRSNLSFDNDVPLVRK